MDGEIPNGTRGGTCTAASESLLGPLLSVLLLLLSLLPSHCLTPALWLLLPACTHLRVLVFGPVQSLILLFSLHQHSTTTCPCSQVAQPYGLPSALILPPQLSRLTPLPSPLCLRQDMATLLARGPAWRALSTKDSNFLVSSMPQSRGCYQMQGFFEEAMLSLCNLELQQADFHYHCLDITTKTG